jgi:predicted nucleic acid-binding protein
MAELISTFCRLHQKNKITYKQYHQLKVSLLADIEDIAIGDLTPRVLLHTMRSLENNVLRAMAAIHSSAMALKCDVFISADRRQLDAAKQVGLSVEAV